MWRSIKCNYEGRSDPICEWQKLNKTININNTANITYKTTYNNQFTSSYLEQEDLAEPDDEERDQTPWLWEPTELFECPAKLWRQLKYHWLSIYQQCDKLPTFYREEINTSDNSMAFGLLFLYYERKAGLWYLLHVWVPACPHNSNFWN